MNSDTILLQRSQIDRASRVLVEAFDKDPIFQYLGKKSQVNKNALKYFCEIILHNSQRYESAYSNTSDLTGVAAWIPPGKTEMSDLQFFSMFLFLLRKCGWRRSLRNLSLLSALNKRHQQEMTEPHWTLSLLGVDPTCQGRGIGSLLIQPVLTKADRECVPCYLTTFTKAGVKFYQKHGFTVLWQGKILADSPCVWTMKRSPKS